MKKTLMSLVTAVGILASLPALATASTDNDDISAFIIPPMEQGRAVTRTVYGVLPEPFDYLVASVGTPAEDFIYTNTLQATRGVPAVGQVSPGAPIVVNGSSLCSTGFLVSQSERIFSTAGHCGKAGDTISVNINGNLEEVGVITKSIQEGVSREGTETDHAEYQLHEGVPFTAEVLGTGARVSRTIGVQELLETQPEICKSAAVSGVTCGQFVDAKSMQVLARTFSVPGDSGGAAFVKLPDGSLGAIGFDQGVFSETPDEVIFVTGGLTVDTGATV